MNTSYTTTLSTRPFLFQETRQVMTLLLKGMTSEEVLEKALADNLFLLKSEDRIQSFANEILKRVSQLDPFLQQAFFESDNETAKAILLYGILKKDRLFYEWMREVVRDKFLVMDMTLTKKETLLFLDRKGEQSEKVRNWTDATKERLANAYHRTIEEAGFLQRTTNGGRLHRLMIAPNVLSYLKAEKEQYIVEVLLGE